MMHNRHAQAFVALALCAACKEDKTSDQVHTTGATVAPPQIEARPSDQNDGTINRIAAARCARELACNNIGTGKKWTDDAACRREARQNLHADLRPSECHVVLTSKVQQCVEAIQNEKCDSMLDFSLMAACRNGAICQD